MCEDKSKLTPGRKKTRGQVSTGRAARQKPGGGVAGSSLPPQLSVKPSECFSG